MLEIQYGSIPFFDFFHSAHAFPAGFSIVNESFWIKRGHKHAPPSFSKGCVAGDFDEKRNNRRLRARILEKRLSFDGESTEADSAKYTKNVSHVFLITPCLNLLFNNSSNNLEL